jgi:hypothetical protein
MIAASTRSPLVLVVGKGAEGCVFIEGQRGWSCGLTGLWLGGDSWHGSVGHV